jgi:hypothetical protein
MGGSPRGILPLPSTYFDDVLYQQVKDELLNQSSTFKDGTSSK